MNKKENQSTHMSKAQLESEKNFLELFENVNLISIILDIKGKVIFCNNYLLKITGYTPEEMIGSDWFSLMIPDFGTTVKEEFLNADKRGKVTTHFDSPIFTKNRELLNIRWNNTVIHDDDGVINGTASIGENITERQQKEEALRASEEQLRLSTELADVAVWEYNFISNEMSRSKNHDKLYGLEVLTEIRNDKNLKSIPVVMLTSSKEEPDLKKSYKLGANAYVVKPLDFKEFILAVSEIGIFWALINEVPPQNDV